MNKVYCYTQNIVYTINMLEYYRTAISEHNTVRKADDEIALVMHFIFCLILQYLNSVL